MALQFYGGGDLKSTSSDSIGSFSSYGGCCDTGVDPATVLALIAGIDIHIKAISRKNFFGIHKIQRFARYCPI